MEDVPYPADFAYLRGSSADFRRSAWPDCRLSPPRGAQKYLRGILPDLSGARSGRNGRFRGNPGTKVEPNGRYCFSLPCGLLGVAPLFSTATDFFEITDRVASRDPLSM